MGELLLESAGYLNTPLRRATQFAGSIDLLSGALHRSGDGQLQRPAGSDLLARRHGGSFESRA
jgi:hypothetical protein